MTIRDVCDIISRRFAYNGEKSEPRWYAVGGKKDVCVFATDHGRSCLQSECRKIKANIQDICERIEESKRKEFLFYILKGNKK